jgi:hypothetical protein
MQNKNSFAQVEMMGTINNYEKSISIRRFLRLW